MCMYEAEEAEESPITAIACDLQWTLEMNF